jgi:hypothetical protein
MNRSNEDAEAVMAMTPDERIELAFELGRRGVELYMTAHHVDPETASRELKRAGRAGRRYSRCMDALYARAPRNAGQHPIAHMLQFRLSHKR